MNEFAEWTVKCDEQGCSASVSAQKSTDGAALEIVLRRARRAGWLIEGGFHLCPNHAVKS